MQVRRWGLRWPVRLLGSGRAPAGLAETALATGTGRRVLVVPGAGQGEAVARWRGLLGADDVTVAPADAGLERLDALVRGLPTLDAVVVLRPEEELGPLTHGDLLALLLPALRHGGRYVLDRRVARDLTAPLDDWVAAATTGLPPAPEAARSPAVGLAIGEVSSSADAVVVRVRRTHLLHTREREITALLPAREPGASVRLLESRPPEVTTYAGSVVSHGFDPGDTFPRELACPPLELRHYEAPGGVAVSGRGVAYVGTTLLPETFRRHLADRPHNLRLQRSHAEGWSRLLPVHRPRRHLPGAYYHFDSQHLYHFGHLTTEVIARLWGWDRAKRELPGLRIIMVHWRPEEPRPTLQQRFLEAYDIAPEDVVWVDEPVTVDALVGATPMWHQARPYYVHPGLRETWDRIGHGLTGGDLDGEPGHERLFVSRGSGAGARHCRNQQEVERFVTERGYELVYPEQLSLVDQVRLFRGARVVAGFGGSGLFNVMHARSLERLVVLNHEGYTARNEHLFSALLGNDQDYLWSAPDSDAPPGPERFQSSWAFDLDRHAATLDGAPEAARQARSGPRCGGPPRLSAPAPAVGADGHSTAVPLVRSPDR